jgi:hypothetical protein
MEPANRPGTVPNGEADMPLGPVGDPSPPQAENIVANVAPDATWQTPAQNRRRDREAEGFDMTMLARGRTVPAQQRGHRQIDALSRGRSTMVGLWR